MQEDAPCVTAWLTTFQAAALVRVWWPDLVSASSYAWPQISLTSGPNALTPFPSISLHCNMKAFSDCRDSKVNDGVNNDWDWNCHCLTGLGRNWLILRSMAQVGGAPPPGFSCVHVAENRTGPAASSYFPCLRGGTLPPKCKPLSL